MKVIQDAKKVYSSQWLISFIFAVVGALIGAALSFRVINLNEFKADLFFNLALIIVIFIIYFMTFTTLRDSLFGHPGLFISNLRIDRKSGDYPPILFSESIEKYKLYFDINYGKMYPVYNKKLSIKTTLNLDPPIYTITQNQLSMGEFGIDSESLNNINVEFALDSPNFEQMELYQNYDNVKLNVTLQTIGIGKNIDYELTLNIGKIKLFTYDDLLYILIKKGYIKKGEALRDVVKIGSEVYKTNIYFDANYFIQNKGERETEFIFKVIKRLIYSNLYELRKDISKFDVYEDSSLSNYEQSLSKDICDLPPRLKKEIEEYYISIENIMRFTIFQNPEFCEKLKEQEKGMCLFGFPTDKITPIINLNSLEEIVKQDKQLLDIIMEKK